MGDVTRDWWVYSTAIGNGATLLLKCLKTDARGYVSDPTPEEWSRAYRAPSDPYPFDGDQKRIKLRRRETA